MTVLSFEACMLWGIKEDVQDGGTAFLRASCTRSSGYGRYHHRHLLGRPRRRPQAGAGLEAEASPARCPSIRTMVPLDWTIL